jgi:acyl carrier protein
MTGSRKPVELIEVLAGVLELDAAAINDDDGPTTLPEWTSLRHLEVIVTLEEVYRISLSYQEIRDMPSIAHLRAVLREKGIAT